MGRCGRSGISGVTNVFMAFVAPWGLGGVGLQNISAGESEMCEHAEKELLTTLAGSTGVIMTVCVSVCSRNSLLQLLERFARTRTLYGSNRK
jgi:hypothetical protein